MFRSASVAITDPSDTARVFLSGTDDTIPVIAFGPGGPDAFEITLNSQTLTPVEQAAWLRSFAGLVEDLAEQVERRHDLTSPTWTAEEYRCTKCDAQFGIAGTNTGTPEDDAADEHFRDEVERHESGACSPAKTASEIFGGAW